MTERHYAFQQVDVFTNQALKGNPLAVVLDARGITDREMAQLAHWTNLSETSFLMPPRSEGADYALRIFTPHVELPFAGHPTLGSCHAWLNAGGQPQSEDVIQECGLGLIRIRQDGGRLGFAAPPLQRKGAVALDLQAEIAAGLGLSVSDFDDAQWIANGPEWMGFLIKDPATLFGLKPDFARLKGHRLGVVTPSDIEGVDFEVRGFTAAGYEDPVTGSLNAGIAQWLIGSGIAPSSYVARQGTMLGRDGRIYVTQDQSEIWVGGDVTSCINGRLTL